MSFEDEDKLNPANPIDGVVANLAETIHRKGRGFTLGVVPSGATTSIEVKESLPPHDEWEPPTPYRGHAINDTESFIDYAKRYGDPKTSLVFVAQEQCTIVIDEQPTRGERETITMRLLPSDDWTAWSGTFGKAMNHRDLYMFLVAHEQNLSDATIVSRLSKMSSRAEVDHNSDLQQFGAGEVGFKFKTTAGEEMAQFPTKFGINLPVLDQDVGDGTLPPQKIEVRLQIEMPLSAGKPPMFTLIAPEWKQAMTRRVKQEIDRIKSGLEGFAVIHGKYSTNARKLPAQKS